MQFLPRSEVLSFEEIDAIVQVFMARGLKKLRLTGGEPLVRRDIMGLVERLSSHLGAEGLEELTLTTNGSQLVRYADQLVAAGVRRINVSLDSLLPDRFKEITRIGDFSKVMAGIDAAEKAGLSIKINMVAMRGINDDEIVPMIRWAHGRGFGATLIESMPLGDVALDRHDVYLPLRELHEELSQTFSMTRLDSRTGGPARYFQVAETGGRLGYISPMSHNFCESCNRVRLTCTGELYLCLGQDDKVDLRVAYRENGVDGVHAALDEAMRIKPKGHDFLIDRARPAPAVTRHMSVTGG